MENDSIDLIRLLHLIRKRLWIIALAALVSVGIAGVYTFFVIPEEYSADVLLYIWQDKTTDNQGSVSSSDLALFSQLVNDYQVLAKSRLVTSQVAEELGLASAGGLGGKIAVGTKSNTRLLTITVHDVDPVFAATLANKVAEVFAQVVVDKMGAGNVNIIDQATTPSAPSSPNKPRNLTLGLIVGIAFGVGLILLIDFLDTTVKTPEDVEAITGFTLLGAIPEYEKDPQVAEGRR